MHNLGFDAAEYFTADMGAILSTYGKNNFASPRNTTHLTQRRTPPKCDLDTGQHASKPGRPSGLPGHHRLL